MLRTRAHAVALARPIALGVAAVALLAVVVASLDGVQHVGGGGATVALVCGAAAVAAVVRLVRRIWDWERTLIEITAREVVIERRGLGRQLSVIRWRRSSGSRCARAPSAVCSTTGRSRSRRAARGGACATCRSRATLRCDRRRAGHNVRPSRRPSGLRRAARPPRYRPGMRMFSFDLEQL